MEQFSFSKFLVALIQNPQSTLVIFCAVLLAALMGWIPTPLTQSLNILEKTVALIERHQDDTRQEIARRTAADTYEGMLLRAICRNQVPLNAQGQCEPRYRGWEEK